MITVRFDTKTVIKNLEKMTRKEIPAAVSKGLTRASFDVRDRLNQSTTKYFDRPTPFTQKCMAVKGSTIRTMTAYAYVKRIQQQFLMLQVSGGTTGKRKVVPSREWPKNAYGNIPRNTTKGANVFVGKTRKNQRAYFKRRGGKNSRFLQMIGFIPFTRSYSKMWPFFGIGEAKAVQAVPKKIRAEVIKVL